MHMCVSIICIGVYIYIYIYMPLHELRSALNISIRIISNRGSQIPQLDAYDHLRSPRQNPKRASTANLRAKILDSRGFDSSRILNLRGGIIMSTGSFQDMLSQRILAGIILVGIFVVLHCLVDSEESLWSRWNAPRGDLEAVGS